jgi:hypothetical protein
VAGERSIGRAIGRKQLRTAVGNGFDHRRTARLFNYDILADTDESDRRLELLYENVKKYGTVFNTVAPGTQLRGGCGAWIDSGKLTLGGRLIDSYQKWVACRVLFLFRGKRLKLQWT